MQVLVAGNPQFSCRTDRGTAHFTMARTSHFTAAFFLVFVFGINLATTLKCRADDEVASGEDYREAVRVCMSNITNERDEQAYRPDDGGGGGSNQGGGQGGGRRQHNRNRGDRHSNGEDSSSGGGGGYRRPMGRPSGRPGQCEYGGSWGGGSGGGYGNNGGYGGSNGGSYGNNGGYGGSNNGGYNGGGYGGGGGGGGYGGYGGVPQHRNRGPPGGSVMQGGPVGGPMSGGIPLSGRPRSRRSPYGGSRDGRLGTQLSGVEACIVHCIFRQMQMLNDDGRPDRDAIISVMTQRVRDRELKEFIRESVQECFEFSQAESSRSLNKCEFAKTLAGCLEEKAMRHCDDWDDDGNSRGDQRGGDRMDKGSNNQRPPRQHYVGR